MSVQSVAVVGAGVAGLGAAWRLARRGYRVALFDCERRPGGRARPVVRDGFTIERLGAVVSSGDRALLRWLVELDLPELLPPRPVVHAIAHGDRLCSVDARSPLGVARIPGVPFFEALRLRRLPRLVARFGERIDPEWPERAASLDDRSLADFGALYFGGAIVERWMGPLVARASLAGAHEASRVLFLHQHRDRAGERLGVLRSSSQEFIDRAAAAVPSYYGARLARVESPRSGGARFAFSDGERERCAGADALVLAVPAPEAARLAEGAGSLAERDALARVRYAPELSLAIALRRPFHAHPQQIQFPHAAGGPLETALFEPGIEGGRVPPGRGLALLRATARWSEAYFDAPDDTVRKELTDALARVVPRIHGAALFAEVLRERRAVPRFDVGRYREIAAFRRIQLDLRERGRRLYFAGDYLMGPGWNAALRSGQRAAREVEEDLGPAASGAA
ncbi:MAG TPA: FAD-dependent oxidoreductase [Myxococcota bacterium]|nr:FAD-dependent oxidoreductase [Myxococcota bacterium]